jgi:hypothetical protein
MRLANFVVQLDVPRDAAEDALDRMCDALEALDLKTLLQEFTQQCVRTRRDLHPVRVNVEE